MGEQIKEVPPGIPRLILNVPVPAPKVLPLVCTKLPPEFTVNVPLLVSMPSILKLAPDCMVVFPVRVRLPVKYG